MRRAAVHGEEAILTFAEALSMYVEDGKDTRFTLKLLDHFGKKPLKEITGPEIRKAARILYPEAAPATLNRQVINPMRAIINFAAEARGLPKVSVKRFKEERRARPAGTAEWIERFCKSAISMDMPETAAIVRFLFETATRVSEACRLEWDDVNLQEGVAYLRKTKTEPRRVFLTRGMVAMMANIRQAHPRLVFAAANRSTVQKRVDRVISKTGLPRLTSHEFGRHGFATEMIVRHGVDIATTADHGGWKSRRLLMETYVEGNADREVIDRVFGKKRS
ncbi:tyrosine-type recombinase/integrase [Allorhizobium undicola]|uniref:tyrosine-type recombinase/integrase n=1 Tax=Allorhizobium undicola TaxID=78527 RepID=UPI003D33644F